MGNVVQRSERWFILGASLSTIHSLPEQIGPAIALQISFEITAALGRAWIGRVVEDCTDGDAIHGDKLFDREAGRGGVEAGENDDSQLRLWSVRYHFVANVCVE